MKSLKSPIAKRGFGALAIVLLFTSIFMIATSSVGDDAVRLLNSNSGDYLQRKANFAAYAALQQSLSELDKSTAFNGGQGRYFSTWDPGQTIIDRPMDGDPETTYSVTLDNNSSGALGNPFTDADGTVVPVGLVYIKVTAKSRPNSGSRGRTYRASIASLGFVGQVFWQHVILASHKIKLLNGAIVDSYDSADPVAYPNGALTRGAAPMAIVASNGIKGSIELGSATNVTGKIRWGPNGSEAQALVCDSTAVVPTDRQSAAHLYRIPRFKPPYKPVPNAPAIVLAPGETRTLDPGAYKSAVVPAGAKLILQTHNYDSTGAGASRYYFNDSIEVDGGTVELKAVDAPALTSRVEVYVGTKVSLVNGARVNPWVSPADSRAGRMQLIFVGNGSPRSPQQLSLDQASSFYGLALGSGLVCTLDHGSQLFGAVRAFDLTLDHSSKAHWDRSTRQDNLIRGQIAWTLQGLINETLDMASVDFASWDGYTDPTTGGGDGGGDGSSGDGGSDPGGGDAGSGDE